MSNDMFLTDRAVAALMMALQKSLMEQSDIVPVLKAFKFRLVDEGLIVTNPPPIRAPREDASEDISADA